MVTEMSRMRWADLTGLERPVESHVTLTLRHTKGRKVRTITLRQQVIDILLRMCCAEPRSNATMPVSRDCRSSGLALMESGRGRRLSRS